MEILHVAAEVFPMAKTGGLADVSGALPKYLQDMGHYCKVVMPMHRTKFLYDNDWEVAHKGAFNMGTRFMDFTVIKLTSRNLGFDLFCIDINGLLDRERVYGYGDDEYRYLAFQIAVLEWMSNWQHEPDVVHVHDHHTALIPFMLKYCYRYSHRNHIPTVLTIHNAQYQGWMSWETASLMPAWDSWKWGLLEWDETVNSLACGVKCADKVTTVSNGYLEELKYEANGLEALFNYETGKCVGILNGIDYEVWNSETDTLLYDNFSLEDKEDGKQKNKSKLCHDFGFDPALPLFVFIGRLVPEKAADLIPQAIRQAFYSSFKRFNFILLGSGNAELEGMFYGLQSEWTAYVNSRFEYNERLSHQMYAGADFLIMPSRIEPCGLNQMYAMRYGTIPIVRRTGGLKDTVLDFGDGGWGICFDRAWVGDLEHSLHRAVNLYDDHQQFISLRKKCMEVNNSWEKSAQIYVDIYNSI